MLLPAVILLAVFFVVPLEQLLHLSLVSQQPSPNVPNPPLTLANFTKIAGDPYIWKTTLNSLLVGITTTAGTLVVGYPVAFYLTRARGWERTIISVACLLPLFVNVIVGILGWYILLLPFGVVQQALAGLGLIDGPLPLLRTFPALVTVLTYEHLPFAVLILAAALQAIPAAKLDAARMLGAGAVRIAWNLVLPLTMPGLVATAVLVFSLSTSSYLTPILIGAQRVPVLPMAIFSYGTELMNWPLAAALSFVLLVMVGLVAYGFSALMGTLTHRGRWENV